MHYLVIEILERRKLPRPYGWGFGVSSGLHDALSSPLRGVYVPPTHASR